ncbi:hypothetical protein [Roseomonas marmotae]|uniref:Tripartite tricarboxylate transporter substrate binding protein n=1 Tax=Roseomonas marmotae TaxID=2768161 RepID=A0ABS3K9B3_9PROT|nr:hypothetical protein [Roseomonas marmotae]MBO1073607.1 hypothetical protein [Roseomonas marmotae]QTI80212.1 hypothetical protein IAI58_05500 [Roseomonas marmotae]
MPRIARRGLPALAAALLSAGMGGARAQGRTIDTATLLMPGPEGGPAALWAARVATGLARGLPHAIALHSVTIGGPDGVTTANRFATMEGVEGRTLLVLPGSAVHAWLIGESRARYPVEGWLPLCASWQGAILAGRGPMPAPNPSHPLRLALPAPEAPEAAALLGLDLAGYAAQPVFGLNAVAAEQALMRGEVDAIVIVSPMPLRHAARIGATPWRELETPGRRDHPELPVLAEAAQTARPARIAAAQAGFAALRLRAALVLPALTSADLLALWRRAALRWQEDEAKESPETTAPALVGAEARTAMSALFPSPDGVLAYREWLLRRLSWQAS